MQIVIQGVSTRRIKKITTELCGRELSRQTVSNLTERLDTQVPAWTDRPLEEEYPFLLADAMQLKIRREEAVRSAHPLSSESVETATERSLDSRLPFEKRMKVAESCWRNSRSGEASPA